MSQFYRIYDGKKPSADGDRQYYYYDRTLLGSDSYSFMVKSNTDAQTLTALERFELVSSLYSPGNIICWFLLLASVLVGWTVNPPRHHHQRLHRRAHHASRLCRRSYFRFIRHRRSP
ncbi:hypothetical protein B0T16DRAFT_101408 [Cercophora newfieldiana]|uniref:Uncharacterized protein n=1 Tax=Cercophora newfieldiana TaxID=92897 RepID=A0AA39YGX3_9PEZI|nr:hypothetical protein B0T16DRAFT_101408 [Cercophora newfieldiana]